MANLTDIPSPNIPAGIAALDAHLPAVLEGKTLADIGWSRVSPYTLCIPLWAMQQDFYLLRLQFDCYPEWPPGAQFVNPITKNYEKEKDVCWLPVIEAPNLRVHKDYQGQGQLICNSSTCEFYKVRHALDKPEHIWKSTYTFMHTLSTIRHAMYASYSGRMS